MNPQKIKSWAPWVLVFAAALAVHLSCVSNEIGGNLGGDNVVYFLLGKALAAGKGYVDLYLPGEPAHVKYPFMFPLLLAPFHALLTKPLPAMHVMVILCNVTAAVLAGVLLGRRFSSRWVGPLLGGSFALIPAIYLQSLNLLSEPLYMALAFGALLASEVAGERMSGGRFAATALLALAAWFTRSAGIALVAALAAVYWLKLSKVKVGKREVPAALMLLALFTVLSLVWFGRNHLAGGDAVAYRGEFLAKDPYHPELGRMGVTDLVRRSGGSLAFYAPGVGLDAVGPAARADLRWLGWPLLGLIGLGVASQWGKGRRKVELYFLLSLGIVVVWPFREERFLTPLLPLSAFYLVAGLEWTAGKLAGEERARRWVAPAAALLLLIQAPTAVSLVRDRFVDGREPKAPVAMNGRPAWTEPVINFADYDFDYRDPRLAPQVELYTDFIIINRAAAGLIPPGAVLASRKPMWTYYLSGHHCVSILGDPNPFHQREFLKEQKVDYLVMGLNEDSLLPLLKQWWQARDDRFQVTAEIPRGRAALIRVNRNRL